MDQNWVTTLLNGALSTTIQMATDQQIRSTISNIFESSLVLNDNLISKCGFFLRSALVSRHPGLLIGPAGSNVSQIRHPDPNVLQCFFSVNASDLSVISITEPPEQFHFGFANSPDSGGSAIYIRDPASGSFSTGGETVSYSELEESKALDSTYYTIDGDNLKTILASKLPLTTPVTPWVVALQLIPGPVGITLDATQMMKNSHHI